MTKLWSSRFTEPLDEAVEEFTSSIQIDRLLFKEDILGSIAHVRMLSKIGIITQDEENKLIEGLKSIESDIRNARLELGDDKEDIHMAIEMELIRRLGDVAYKLHTARSRNDQIALDLRLYIFNECKKIVGLLKEYRRTMVGMAVKHIDVIMPAFTHLRPAQNVLFSHYMLAFYEMARRDERRFEHILGDYDQCPIGAGALSGTSLPIDRHYEADLLGFSNPTSNSIDTVSDRDIVVDILFSVAISFVHLSRLCEDLIILSSPAFGFFELPERFCTGSSLMPHKKNPDVLELIRGKSSIAIANVNGLLVLLKGLPTSYNRDLQEDKTFLFESLDAYKRSIAVITALIGQISIQKKNILTLSMDPSLACVDIVEFLIKKGMPFRKAYDTVGKMVKDTISNGKKFNSLSLEDFRKYSNLFDENVFFLFDPKSQINCRVSYGSSGLKAVMSQIKKACHDEGIEFKKP